MSGCLADVVDLEQSERQEGTPVVDVTGRAAYLQIADALRNKIRSGELAPGDALPSLSQLMAEFGVSNTVVRSAMQILRSEGLVVGQQGKGVYVREPGGPLGADASPDFLA